MPTRSFATETDLLPVSCPIPELFVACFSQSRLQMPDVRMSPQ
jgi:hypothetical protein